MTPKPGQKGAPKVPGSGRKAGTPNRATSVAREAWGRAWEQLAPDVASWIREVHDGDGAGEDGRKPDPAKAAELALRMAEYHVPKLAQQALTGADGGALTIVVQSLAEVPHGEASGSGEGAGDD